MGHLTKLLRDSYDLQENEPKKSAYWHLQQLRSEIKQLALHDASCSCADKEEIAFGKGYNLGAKEAADDISSRI
jgi:hypothetical protein